MELRRYCLKFSLPPFERRGAIVSIHGALGDLAPFPGTHCESLEEAIAGLERGDRSLPSVAFALDMAAAPRTGADAPSYRLIYHGEALPKEACPVKLKVGQNLENDIERIKQLHALGCSIRLDASRRWNMEEALQFAKRCTVPIEYIEEPLRKSGELSRFYSKTGLPLALDETLYLNEPWEGIEGVTTLILKPSALGPLRRTRELADRGKDVVISSCFESETGIAFLKELSAAINPGKYAGLDTLRFFEEQAA